MGGALSTGNNASATAANYSLLNANTNVASQESCNNSQVINYDKTTATFGSINCDTFTFGKTVVTAKQTCNQYAQIAVLAKVIADQSAKTEASSGIGFLNQSKSNSSNYIQVQNNIETIIASSCTNSQKINVQTRSFTAGSISGNQCDIFSDSLSQEAFCIQTVLADIANNVETSQDAEAKATAGLDLQQVILFLILICVVLFVFTLCAAVIRAMLRGGSSKDILKSSGGIFGSGGASISELRAKLSSLKMAEKARQMAQQNYLNGLNAVRYLKK